MRVVPFAIHEKSGTLEFYRAAASTFAHDLPSSPALANDNFNRETADTFTVESRRFDEVDDGTIDLLSIDTEGCEWYVLKFMASRPKIISVETGTKRYVNPFLSEIRQWMILNEYCVWYRHRSDTVFALKSALTLAPLQRILHWFSK